MCCLSIYVVPVIVLMTPASIRAYRVYRAGRARLRFGDEGRQMMISTRRAVPRVNLKQTGTKNVRFRV